SEVACIDKARAVNSGDFRRGAEADGGAAEAVLAAGVTPVARGAEVKHLALFLDRRPGGTAVHAPAFVVCSAASGVAVHGEVRTENTCGEGVVLTRVTDRHTGLEVATSRQAMVEGFNSERTFCKDEICRADKLLKRVRRLVLADRDAGIRQTGIGDEGVLHVHFVAGVVVTAGLREIGLKAIE